MVDSVTTIGCMRRTATKKPLKAPDSHADADAGSDQDEHGDVAGSCSDEARTTLTSEITAPAERSKPPDRMTMRLADRRQRQRRAARRHVATGRNS